MADYGTSPVEDALSDVRQLDLYARQIELEREMQGLGTKRFWDALQEARKNERESGTAYGVRLLASHIDPLAAAIRQYLNDATTRRGRRHVAVKYLSDIDPDVAAFITIKSVLDSVTLRQSLQRVALNVAAGIEDEARFRHFEAVERKLWERLTADLDSRTKNPAHKRRVLIHSMNKAARKKRALKFVEWPESEKLHLGQMCVSLLIQATKLVRIVNVDEAKHKTTVYVQATDETMEWIDARIAHCELLTPVFLPTVIRPKAWTNPYNGGYHSHALRPLRLVKTRNRNYLEELHNRKSDMPALYASINAIQNTGWRVNRRVLAVMQQVWESGLNVGDVMGRCDIPLPPKPEDIQTNKEARTTWKRAASKIYQANAKLRSRRLQAAKILWVADKFKEAGAFYFPHQLDFRGRLYAVPSFLNPQGCDAAKGLLEFAEGKPIQSSAALRWLKIHLANTFGEDKCSLDDRVSWVGTHTENILAVANDPLGARWWMEADKPWQFLAACFEFLAATTNPEHLSHLPVSVDGACNGLQNFSAMLRDEVGGAAVNLIPASLPQDIYQRVADVVTTKVRRDATAGESDDVRGMAQAWLVFGFDRKATKRPVMVLPYGGTLYSSRSFVQDYLNERVESGDVLPWEDTFKPAVYLAKHIWDSIGEVVIAARAAMDWLQEVSRLASSEGLPVTWTTPDRFPVLQAYPEVSARRVKTQMGDSIIKLTLNEELDSIDRRRQAQGISPNFVHSMDATCLRMTVTKCVGRGIRSFSMVHDSFGTHAADMEQMASILREAFVELYQHDVLQEFRNNIFEGLTDEHRAKLPPCPPKGRLDLEAVRESVYFFA